MRIEEKNRTDTFNQLRLINLKVWKTKRTEIVLHNIMIYCHLSFFLPLLIQILMSLYLHLNYNNFSKNLFFLFAFPFLNKLVFMPDVIINLKFFVAIFFHLLLLTSFIEFLCNLLFIYYCVLYSRLPLSDLCFSVSVFVMKYLWRICITFRNKIDHGNYYEDVPIQ